MEAKRRVLISVSDKAGLVEYGRGLVDIGCELVSTGGTAKKLREAGLPVTEVSDLTGSPEMLDDRVKTLHPKVHAGLIADRDNEGHLRELIEQQIELFAALIINLYPMEAEIARPGATFESVTKNIDIGGPAMMRSAFKGRIPVIIDPADTVELIQRLQAGTHLEHAYCDALINKGRALIANYTTREAEWSSKGQFVGILGEEERKLCYGESKRWQAKLYRPAGSRPLHRLAVSNFKQVGGGIPSYINVTDLMSSRRTMVQIVASYQANFGSTPYVAIAVKHGKPCGVGVAVDPVTAVQKMVKANPTSIFGGTVLLNFGVTAEVAKVLRTEGVEADEETAEVTPRGLDVVIGASFDEGACEALERKRGKCRMFENPALLEISAEDLPRRIVRMDDYGEFLVQEGEPYVFRLDDPELEKFGELSQARQADMVLADAICRTVQSNTIVLVKDQMMIACAAGQDSRIGAAELAISIARKNGHNPKGSVAASDSFFMSNDCMLAFALAGIKAVLTTRGSIRDGDVKAAALLLMLILWWLPDTKRGFYKH